VFGGGFLLEVDGQAAMIGLDDHGFADQPGRDRVGVAVEVDGEIGMHLGGRGVAAIGAQVRQGLHGVGPDTVDRPAAGGGMHPDIGHLIAPLVGLFLDIAEPGEGPQGPEIMTNEVDGAFFHLALFLRLPDVAGPGRDLQGAQELEKGVVEADQRAVPFDDGGEHVVMHQGFRGAAEKNKGIKQAAMQGFLALGMRELEIEHAAVTLDDCQAVKLARGVAVMETAEMAPVHLALFAGSRFETDEGPGLALAGRAQISPQDGEPAGKSLGGQPLLDHRGRDMGIDVQEAVDLVLEGAEFAWSCEGRSSGAGVAQVVGDSAAVMAELFGDFADREALVGQAVDLEDGSLFNHGLLPGWR
jgi:hypothetical protein